jgi:CRISPR-associated protein Cmr6
MIPLPKDTRGAVGDFGEKVENRSLLFEKMVLPKTWGHRSQKFNDANRFNVLRASTAGAQLLSTEGKQAANKAKNDRDPALLLEKAEIAAAMAKVKVDDPELAKRQIENAKNLLSLIQLSYEGRAHTLFAKLRGRLLINMAGGVHENAGMSLDRCFGLPFIPGSAVKGATRNAALWDILSTSDIGAKKEKIEAALAGFGFAKQDISERGDFVWAAEGDVKMVEHIANRLGPDGAFSGLLSFLPAQPLTPPQVIAEVLTRHPGAQDAAKGTGSPLTIFFPAVKEGSEFGFAFVQTRELEGIAPESLQARIAAWLECAITSNGIGAKTGAGYGWFSVDPQAEKLRRDKEEEQARRKREREQKEALEKEVQREEERRLQQLSPQELASEAIKKLSQEEFATFAKKLAEKTEPEKRAFLAVLGSKEHKDTRKRWSKNKPEIWAVVQSQATQIGIAFN